MEAIKNMTGEGLERIIKILNGWWHNKKSKKDHAEQM